jgi:hypothetical protein
VSTRFFVSDHGRSSGGRCPRADRPAGRKRGGEPTIRGAYDASAGLPRRRRRPKADVTPAASTEDARARSVALDAAELDTMEQVILRAKAKVKSIKSNVKGFNFLARS